MKYVAIPALLYLVIFASPGNLTAQELDPAITKNIVESKNFVFRAQTMSPAKGAVQHLTTNDYDLVVVGDSVIAFLPYFGRAYSAPIGSEGGIKFASARSNYKMKQKKNKWEISIEPGDVEDVQQLFLDVFENGRASLRITSINRQPISFNGYLVEGKERIKRAF